MPRPRIVIVGSGFAGFQAAKRLRRLMRHRAEIVVVNPTNYFLYLPLLPRGGRRASSTRAGWRCRCRPRCPASGWCSARSTTVDLDAPPGRLTDPEDNPRELGYDRLVLAVGSVNKLLPIPGVAEHAHGFRGLPEALYLRDHIIRQIELAPPPTTRPSARPAARSWWSAPATPAPRSPPTASCFTDALPDASPRLRRCAAALAAAGHRPAGAAGAGRSACPATADQVLRGAGSRCARAPRSRRRTPTGSGCHRRRVRADPHARSGASGYARTRWSSASGCRPSRAGWWSTST